MTRCLPLRPTPLWRVILRPTETNTNHVCEEIIRGRPTGRTRTWYFLNHPISPPTQSLSIFLIAPLEGRRLNQITVDALDTARQDLLTKGCTPQRVNRYMAWLRHVLNGAIHAGKLSSNPVTKLKMFKEPKGKTRFLSFDEEYKKLYPELGTTYAPWARLAILTGLRQEEQFTLRWSHIDLDRGLITLPTTKAGDCQYLPLNEEAITILRALDSWKYSAWVFPSENPATYMDPRNFYTRVWVPAVKRAGIEWVTWHDLRHTFASRLAMNGASEGTIAALLRHSTTALVKRYAHLSPSHLRAAVEGVANFGKVTKIRAWTVCRWSRSSGWLSQFFTRDSCFSRW